MRSTDESGSPAPPGDDSPPPAPGAWGAALAEAIGDRLNPILVKETRQALKSRQFTLWFVLLLAGCWVTTLGAVALIGPSIYYVSAGRYLLTAYYVILAVPLIVVAPFSAYRSLSSEHEESTRDLLEVSTLTSLQLVNGKLGGALLQVIVYLSALAPCIAFTYLLRGVELRAILLLLVYAVLASIGLSAVGLLVAASTRAKYAQVVMSVTFAGSLFTALATLLSTATGVLALDARFLRGYDFWLVNAAALTLYATTLAVVYAGAVSLCTFSAANRSTALRWAVLAQQTAYVAWVAWGVIAGWLDRDTLAWALVVAVVYWFVAGALMSGESPTLSMRVRRTLPRSLAGRLLLTWLSPGSGSGYVFAVANVVMLAALTAAAGELFVTRGGFAAEQTTRGALLLAAYFALHLGVGRLVVLGLRRVAEVTALGCFLVQVLVTLGASGMPYVVQTLAERVRVTELPLITYPSPAWNVPRVFDGALPVDRELPLLITVTAASFAVFVVNLALAGREARQLRVAAPRRVVEDDREIAPVVRPAGTNPWGDPVEPVA